MLTGDSETTDGETEPVSKVVVNVPEPVDNEEIVIGYRVDGELHELAHFNPPAEAILRRL